MPFVRIDLRRGKSADYRKALGEIVYQAMRDVINVPENDKFQVITEHAADELNISAGYLGQRYSDDIILIQITLSIGRSVELKKAFYKRIVDDMQAQLQSAGGRRGDQPGRGREGELVVRGRHRAIRDVNRRTHGHAALVHMRASIGDEACTQRTSKDEAGAARNATDADLAHPAGVHDRSGVAFEPLAQPRSARAR